MELVAAAYALSGFLFLGGFACIVIGYWLVRARGRVATTPTEFKGKWGDREVHLGAGSLASLMVASSAIWVIAGVAVKPDLQYTNRNGVVDTTVMASLKFPAKPAEAVQNRAHQGSNHVASNSVGDRGAELREILAEQEKEYVRREAQAQERLAAKERKRIQAAEEEYEALSQRAAMEPPEGTDK